MAKRRGNLKAASNLARDRGVPAELHEAIETERDNLSRAESLLGCLARSMESDFQSESGCGPYYPDIAQMARQMVRNSINGLDSLMLDRALLRNKVKDEGWRELAERYH